MRVYLAGAIWGVEDPVTWRQNIAIRLPEGWEAVDPTQIELFVEDEHLEENAHRIVEADLSAIETCDAVLARVDHPSWGTAMEMFYAHSRHIPVIGWNPRGDSISARAGKTTVGPWVKVHCKIVTPDFEIVKQFLQNLLVKA
jgi:nucleoside 2-deoxyribosyltransferase